MFCLPYGTPAVSSVYSISTNGPALLPVTQARNDLFLLLTCHHPFTLFCPLYLLSIFQIVHFSQFSWLLVELAFLFLLLSTQAILRIAATVLQNSWSTSLFKTLLTSLVTQWLRICLAMQGTRVQFWVWEDPICQGATKSIYHNYWSPCALEPMLSHKRSCWNEKPVPCN